jgi:4-hydroxy-3-methylbut-2-en-1-yl diphosphate synthase IspG/GcpE
VQSAFEFADICRKNDYHNFLFSMKVNEGGREGGREG